MAFLRTVLGFSQHYFYKSVYRSSAVRQKNFILYLKFSLRIKEMNENIRFNI